MFSRKNAYEASDQSKGSDDLSRKLAFDLRKHVRRLEMFPHHSKEWLGVTDSLLHISNVALMEHKLPRDSEDSTLWEGEELTVRFILEEGKLNLCLRLMQEYKKAQATEKAKGATSYAEFLGKAAASCEAKDAEQLKARLLVFEQSLGVLLRCSLEHVEAVQTVDLPLLVAHCAAVLEQCAAAPDAPDALAWERTQEVVVLRYLEAVLLRVEQLGEERVLPLLKQANLLPLVVAQLHAHHALLTDGGCAAGAHFLSLAMDTEDFATYRAGFLPAPTKAQLKSFKPLFLASLTADMEGRKKFRPLLDEVVKAGG